MKVLICSLSGHGFVYPLIRLAHAIVGDGGSAAFVVGLEYADVLAREGFERISRGDKDGSSFEIRWWGQMLSVAMQVKHIEYALTKFTPDVILCSHLTLGPLIVAERLGIPVCIMGGARYLYPALPGSAASRSGAEANRQYNYDEQVRLYNVVRKAFGLAPAETSVAEPALLGDAFLLRAAPGLVPPADVLPGRVRLIGACLWEPDLPDHALEAWLAAGAGRRHAYVQLGRNFDAPSNWPIVCSVLEALQVRAVVSSARFDVGVDPASVPSDLFVRPHVMQGRVLPSCDFVIATGHPTASLGALTHGKPMVLLPNGSGTYDFAAACSEANLAMVMDGREVDAEYLALAIKQLLHDEAIAANVTRVKRALDGIDSEGQALDILRTLAAGQRVGAARRYVLADGAVA